LICIILFTSLTAASTFQKTLIDITKKEDINQDYTHTVFAGVAASQSCTPCHNWSLNMFDTYMSGLYDFEYAIMICFDKEGLPLNYDAIYWALNYSVDQFPSTFFDGDFKKIKGDDIEQLPGILDECGNRTVANITANITAYLIDNATFNISINIENNEDFQYDGYIRTFITEIVSRYETPLEEPFNFGFLDFAFDESISIGAGQTYTDNIIWDGNEHEDAHGDNFGDLKANNIQMTLVVYNNSNGYTDETAKTYIPNNQPNKAINPSPENGEIDVRPDVDLAWNCTDPDGDELFYDIYLGTTNPPPLFASNISENYFDPGLLEFQATYYWYILSDDHRGGTNQSEIWNFTTKNNYIPEIPSKPHGPPKGDAGEELEYVTTTFEPDGDDLYYWFDWDNGYNSGWVGPFKSNEIANATYTWPEGGDYTISVKAKDEYGYESKWSEGFSVHINEPVLEIDNISGGLFKLSADINNIGDGEAKNVDWNIKLSSGIIILGRETSGTFASILTEDKEYIQSKVIIGLGQTKITIDANVDYGHSGSITIDAFLLGFIIIIK